MRIAFSIYDTNQDGAIDSHELENVVRRAGPTGPGSDGRTMPHACVAPPHPAYAMDSPARVKTWFVGSLRCRWDVTSSALAAEGRAQGLSLTAGRNPTPEDIQKLIEQFDIDGDKLIKFDEFSAMMIAMGPGRWWVSTGTCAPMGSSAVKQPECCDGLTGPNVARAGVTEEDAMEAFRVFDLNGDGRITTSELERVMTQMGTPLTQEELAELMADVDVDRDGVIDYAEFTRMMLKGGGPLGQAAADQDDAVPI